MNSVVGVEHSLAYRILKEEAMTKNLLSKYIWLVNTIYQAKKISLKEINQRWLETDMSLGVEIPRRTFDNWKNAAEELFGLVILCDKRDGDRYYIENPEVLEEDSLQRWLLNTMSVNNTLLENRSLSDRILLENIPSCLDYLASVMEAMKKSMVLELTYKSYWREEERSIHVAPYCVKLFRQRWYMIANSVSENAIRIYSLDRVLAMKLTGVSFKYPDDFSPEVYFDGCFGIIHEDDCKLQTVKLKVKSGQANYLRSLPMHPSQQEVERTDDYSIFTLQIRPTFDFQQELLWNTDALEVLEPLWLRKEIAGIVKRMWNNYNK